MPRRFARQNGAAVVTTRLDPEHALLCQCARRSPSRPALGQQLELAPIDWAHFFARAEAHGVTELLLPGLTARRPDVPGSIVERLENRCLEMTALNLQRTRQLADLLQRFQAHGIRALSFKGAALAVGVYGHLGRRSFVDLDVLVHPKDVSRVRPLMLADGYTLPPRRRHRAGSLLYGLCPAAGREDTLLPGRPGHVPVDVQVAFACWTQGIRLDTGALFDRAITVDVADVPIATLGPDDHLLMLAIHGMVHGWSLLRFVSDIDATAGLVADWDAVVRRARAARMLRALRVALFLARDVLGTTLPAPVLALAERDREAIAVAQGAGARLFAVHAQTGDWDPRPWLLSFQERPADKIRFHTRSLIYEWFLKWPWDEWLGRRSAVAR